MPGAFHQSSRISSMAIAAGGIAWLRGPALLCSRRCILPHRMSKKFLSDMQSEDPKAFRGRLSHLDESGAPTMVDVGKKSISVRSAVARSRVWVPDAVMRLMSPDGEMRSAKGPVFATAIIAGSMAAKKTHDLIPFCHPLGLEWCKVDVRTEGANEIVIECTVRVTGKTGVEMEALTGASVAALTVYDMCKAVSHEMVIKETMLVSKTGGKSDFSKQDPHMNLAR